MFAELPEVIETTVTQKDWNAMVNGALAIWEDLQDAAWAHICPLSCSLSIQGYDACAYTNGQVHIIETPEPGRRHYVTFRTNKEGRDLINAFDDYIKYNQPMPTLPVKVVLTKEE